MMLLLLLQLIVLILILLLLLQLLQIVLLFISQLKQQTQILRAASTVNSDTNYTVTTRTVATATILLYCTDRMLLLPLLLQHFILPFSFTYSPSTHLKMNQCLVGFTANYLMIIDRIIEISKTESSLSLFLSFSLSHRSSGFSRQLCNARRLHGVRTSTSLSE